MVTFAYRIEDQRLVSLVEIDTEDVDAIPLNPCAECVCIECGVICQRGGVVLYITCVPCVFQTLVNLMAYINRIAEDMRLMNRQVQTVNTVATVDRRQNTSVQTACTEYIRRVSLQSVLHPCMMPCVRQVTIGDHHLFRRGHDSIAYIELQRHDTVASVQCCQSIYIPTRLIQPALYRTATRVEAIFRIFADRIKNKRLADHTVVNAEVINTVATVIGEQRVEVMMRKTVFASYRVILLMSRLGPYELMRDTRLGA